MDPQTLLYLIPAAGVVGLAYAYATARWIARQDPGDRGMQAIAQQICAGAMAKIGAEYRVLAIVVASVAALLVLLNQSSGGSPLVGVAFVVGASCSAASGYFGMRVATKANVRTASAARRGLAPALVLAFRGGAVMGMCVVGLGLLGLGALFVLLSGHFSALAGIEGGAPEQTALYRVVQLFAGYAMGASSIALFARVGGGIYTKAADVRDNLGDVAGMGADLFESYIAAIVGAMIIGVTAQQGRFEAVVLPMLLAAAGILVSVAATYVVKTKEGGNPQTALNAGSTGAAIVMLLFAWPIVDWFVDLARTAEHPIMFGGVAKGTADLFIPMAAGLAAGVAIGFITDYYCSTHKPPVDGVVEQSATGAATNIIAGLGVGMRSTALPVSCIAAAIYVANAYAGLYGIALAGLGMLATTGIQLAVDAYGPISDNARGIAQLSGLPPEVQARTDRLDAVGNATAAIGKGFAIGSAALAALALFAGYQSIALRDRPLTLTDPEVTIGLLVGGMLPFLFSALAMKAVAIPTQAALRRMVAPGMLALVTPVVMGFWSPVALGGLLAGTLVSGVTLALFMANAGGAWNSARRQIEAQKQEGSQRQEAAVIGDAVGDPFKATAGPSLNILIKLMSIVAVVIAPFL